MEIDDLLIDICVYPDGEQYEEPPSWKSDDYEKRKTALCNRCDSILIVEYMAPFAHCECGTTEWYK